MRYAGVFLRHPVTKQEKLLGAFTDDVTIGKGAAADLALRDLRCNAIHAMIERDPKTDHFTLVDLGSQFGTFFNGKRVEEAVLPVGKPFQIGTHQLVLREISNDVAETVVDHKIKTGRTTVETRSDSAAEKDLLQVSLYWGEQLLDVRTFTPGSNITIGPHQDATFSVTLANPRLLGRAYPLAKYRRDKLALNLPVEATGVLWQGNELVAVDTLRHHDRAKEFGAIAATLKPGDRAEINLGELTLSFRFVAPAELPKATFVPEVEKNVAILLGILAGLYTAFFFWMGTTEVKPVVESVQELPKHMKRTLFDAGIESALKKQQAAIGEMISKLEGGRAGGEEGRARADRRQTKKPETKRAAKNAKTKNKASTMVKNLGRADEGAVLDLDSAFSAKKQRRANDTTAFSGAPQVGNTAAALAGGDFARGTKGFGSGGGGKSVGIGALKGSGTGGAMGAGDYGLSPSKGHEIKTSDTDEIVILGGLDPDIIANRVRQYLPQIQHCYEQQLAVNPKLKGKVTVSFIIKGDGGVMKASVAETSLHSPATESCMTAKILGWKFPKPRGGGTVGVKYPFLLMSNTGQ
ncbi:MAG: AgmX/PglI C-terminal domain-containing protein [Bacteriovoracia bacterium]